MKKLSTFLIVLLAFISHQAIARQTAEKQILWTSDWSPNGKYIAIAGNLDTLKIYHAKDVKPYRSFPIKSTVTRVKWHPSKNLIAVATQNSEDKSCMLNLDTNEKIELNGISPEGARGMGWNHTGEFLAMGDNDGQIWIYDLKGVLISKFKHENTRSITALDWHPAKNVLLAVSEEIMLFDIEGNLQKFIKHRPEQVLMLCVAWHKSGTFFVTGDYGHDQTKSLLQYWDEAGKLLKSIDISKGEYRNLSWNARGNRLVTASDALRIWDAKGKLISEGESKDYLWGVSWNKNGNRIITSSLEQRIVLWNNKAEKILSIE